MNAQMKHTTRSVDLKEILTILTDFLNPIAPPVEMLRQIIIS